MDHDHHPNVYVLVVEDEYFLAEELDKALTRVGVKVVGPVPSVRDALSLIADQRLDAAVLDVNLGGEMVFPVADALAARGIPFMFTTGYDRSHLPARYADTVHREKPIDAGAVAKEIRVYGEGGR